MSDKNLKRLGALSALMQQMQQPQIQQAEIDQRGEGQDLDLLLGMMGIGQRQQESNALLEQTRLNDAMQLQRQGVEHDFGVRKFEQDRINDEMAAERQAIEHDFNVRKFEADKADQEAAALDSFIRGLSGFDEKGEVEKEAFSRAYPKYMGPSQDAVRERTTATNRGKIKTGVDKLRAESLKKGKPVDYSVLSVDPQFAGMGDLIQQVIAEQPQPQIPVFPDDPSAIPFEQIYPVPGSDTPRLSPEEWQRFLQPSSSPTLTTPLRSGRQQNAPQQVDPNSKALFEFLFSKPGLSPRAAASR